MTHYRNTRRILPRFFVLFIVSPYVLAWVPNPEDSTTVEFALGTGSYNDVTRDCNGNITGVEPHVITEAGASVSHNFSDVRVGVKGGVTTANAEGTLGNVQPGEKLWYVNPTVGFNFESVGGDFGLFIPLNESEPVSSEYWNYNNYPDAKTTLLPTVNLRFFRADRIHTTLDYASGLPLVTRGGLAHAGLGIPLGSASSRLWFGLGFYPWDSPALAARADFPVTDFFGLRLGGQVGLGSSSPHEYGASIGAVIRF